MPLRAVIFDFDGVLANTEPLHLAAYQDLLREEGLGLTDEEYYGRYLGYDDEGVFRALAAARDRNWPDAAIRQLIQRKSDRFLALLRDRDVLFSGAAALVRALSAAVPLAVASGALRHEIEAVLERADLRRCFGPIVASGDTPASKPAPDPYLKALALIGDGDSRGCVAIEDSHWGIESAQAAGLRCVAVAHTYAASELGAADLIVEHLNGITLDALRDLCDKG